MKGALCSAVTVIVLCIAAASAQGRAAQAKTTPGDVDACALLTKEIAAAALGETVKGLTTSGRGLSMGSEKASACQYTGSGLRRVNLNLMQFSPDTAAVYKGLCAQKSTQGLTGLGDTACSEVWVLAIRRRRSSMRNAARFNSGYEPRGPVAIDSRS